MATVLYLSRAPNRKGCRPQVPAAAMATQAIAGGWTGGQSSSLIPAASNSAQRTHTGTFAIKLQWYQVVAGICAVIAGCVVLALLVHFVHHDG